MEQFPKPTTKKQIRGFLGITGNSLETTLPLTDLTKKSLPLVLFVSSSDVHVALQTTGTILSELHTLSKLSQCTSLKIHSSARRFGLLLRPSSGSVIQNSTQSDKVKWSEECEHAFNTLKEVLCKSPFLLNPDFTKTFFLQMDASSWTSYYCN